MRVNFHKSQLFPLNLKVDDAHRFAHISSCPLGNFLLKYQGVPLHYHSLSREDIQLFVDKIIKRIAG